MTHAFDIKRGGGEICFFCRKTILVLYLQVFAERSNILRKTIEGYLDSVPSLTFNTIKTLLIMHAIHS